ncbi:hypothetical protein [Pantoea piersonii]|uniref:hypothetical protein n=1 Tax=Pantoea piersonii TaxID=2364647 RepID=UPI0028B15828|nr:hypothetical protein [Pantoea piersonii]
MPVIEDLPDFTHWKTVQEFSITQAALLLAGIDPYDYEYGLEQVKKDSHCRWKMAWGLSEGIVSAIRRGVLTPVQCCAVRWEGNNHWDRSCEVFMIKPTDRSYEISKDETIITRDSLFHWMEVERVDYARKPLRTAKNNYRKSGGWNSERESILIESETESVVQSTLSLPCYDHKSEGLDYVEETIKQFWSTYDPEDPQTAPTKEEVLSYLKSKGAGSNLAAAVDMVLRPFQLRKVGRRKK